MALALIIAGEIGDDKRFDGAYQLMAYVGMDPTKSKSGKSVASGKSHVQARCGRSQVGPHAGYRLCAQIRPITSATTTPTGKAKTKKAPLPSPRRCCLQAHGRVSSPHEGAAPLGTINPNIFRRAASSLFYI
ncbi:transposase [Atopobium sp. oral taxon 416]|uniref:transposase n=1 Tax=Atopobium sp. oral taxon 416 TaxID=712157 RepID=UPI001BACC7C1|nr:transposase [Atopobium sp. oral taxon 416]